jgi:hypothetical protein
MRPRTAFSVSMCVVLIFALASPVWAQQSSGIAGAVIDASGAIMPGVTVEVASPALIGGVRVAFTDGEGRYNVVDLRPGTYSVTFTLPGFSTLVREGILLQVGFTATVDVELAIGALEETITVTGASPLVDIQNTQQQAVLTSESLETLPTGVKGLAMVAKVTPGLKSAGADVGGASGLYTAQAFSQTTYHGKSGIKVTIDGMHINNAAGSGGNMSYATNFAMMEEMAIETGAVLAESDANNVRVNLIPKEGGNSYTFDSTFLYTNDSLQSENLSDDLQSRGVTSRPGVLHLGDVNVTFGGPIIRDKLWFFSATRIAREKSKVQDVFFNATQGTPVFTPDLDRPGFRESAISSTGGRLTWQATPRNRISTFTDYQSFQVWGIGENVAIEAQTRWDFYPAVIMQTSWTSPLTNRLLIEAAWSGTSQPVNAPLEVATDNLDFAVSPETVSILELSTGFRYNARATYLDPCFCDTRHVGRFAISYVTGSHAFKTGFTLQRLNNDYGVAVNQDINYLFFRGVPNGIVQYASPWSVASRTKADLGIYVQDRWTIDRLALNLGLRMDYINGFVPEQDLPATRFISERSFDAVPDVPEWTDFNPRIGAAYDLFGNGGTALKVSVARYVGQLNANVASANNPINSSINAVTRQWADADGDFVPDCDLGNFSPNGECGAITNQNFGQNRANATLFNDDILRGRGTRDHFWDFIVEIEQQIGSSTSLAVSYNRTWTDNPAGLRLSEPQANVGWDTGVTDNLAVTPEDYDPYCVTAPVDPRLPEGGGYQVCGLYDIKPEKFGQGINERRSQRTFGDRTRDSDYFSVILSTRVGSDLTFSGNVDTGRVVEDDCFVVDSPQQMLNCRKVLSFGNETIVKVNGSYQLPYDVVVAAVFQNLPGATYGAEYRATNAEIAPSLGRNLGACRGATVCNATALVPLFSFQQEFEPRRTQLDLRLGKLFSLASGMRMQVDLSVFNALNSSAVYRQNNNFGSQWRQPLATSTVGTGAVDGRLVQFGGSMRW